MTARVLLQYQSTSGETFSVSPSLVPDIEALIDTVRAEIANQRAAGRYIGYMSVPVSSKSGGDFQTNIDLAAHVAARIMTVFGHRLWILNPAAYNLPKMAQGGDYMSVWSDVLAGADGSGLDFDMAYFVGPNDVWEFFGVSANDRLGKIESWLAGKAAASSAYKVINDDPSLRQKFVRYYGLRGSTIYSKGAHDEWNIVAGLNAKRAIGEDIAVYFDGQPIEPGDYKDTVDVGYRAILH